MSQDIYQYAMARENVLVYETQSRHQRQALKGTIVKIDFLVKDGYISIRFLDDNNTHFEDVSYYCKRCELIPIAECLWSLLLGIQSLFIRSEVAKNMSLCVQLFTAHVGSKIEVLYNNTFCMAMIRYIGPVKSFGPGSYFGLELQGKCESTNCDGSYAGVRYFIASEGTGLFVSIEKLKPVAQFISTIKNKKEKFVTMSRKDNKYAVSKVNVLVQGMNNTRSNEQRTSLLGTVVKVENILGNGNVAIRFLDKSNTSFEDATYCCKQSELMPVSETLWPMLIAIPSPLLRSELALNMSLCDQLISMKCGTSVEVLHNKSFYMGVIKYIGPVQTMGAGSYYGLELLVRSHSQLTSFDGSYAGMKYFNALPGTGLFVSVDKLKPVVTFLATINKKYETNYPVFESAIQEVELRNVEYQKEKQRSVSERVTRGENDVDLIELLGGSWPGVSDKKSSNANEHSNRATRNKSLNIVSHLINPRKSVKVSPKNDNATTVSIITNTVTSSSQMKEPDDNSAASYYDTPTCSTNLTVGTLVEVSTDISDPLYGVIRWVGSDGLAGVELEEDHEHLPLDLTDGMHKGQRYFTCSAGRALFVPVSQCLKDSRFQDDSRPPTQQASPKMFGKLDSPVVTGAIPPLSMPTEEDVLAVCGKFRGIQGHHNSCYLDATLFAMFTYTSVFDSLLFRPRTNNDITHYEEVQRVLREEIVNPLRQNLYVRADRVMKLRTLLEELSSVTGLTSEEKDPEEFLNSLLAQILKAEPFLKLSSGQEAFHYQLFVEKDEGLALPSVQQLFEQSFLSSDIKLKEVPSCLIIQMPRFGKSFKMYPRILPSQLLDVTDIIENSPRQCTVCGKLAQFECRDCFGQCGVGLESTGFCAICLEKAHSHINRSSHSPKPLTVPQDFAEIAEHCPPPRLYMELFAVVCIETSHYVAFVKCGSGHEAPWCFFDSMADRKGEQNGYNIPEMVACPDVSNWLSDDGAVSRLLHEATPHDKQLPEHARRLLCDAYICMYQSPDVMMYR